MRWGFLLLAFWFVASPVRAQSDVRVSLTSTEGCISADGFETRLRALEPDHTIVITDLPPIDIAVSIAPARRGFHALIRPGDQSAERRVDTRSTDCRDLDDALAFIVSLVIEALDARGALTVHTDDSPPVALPPLPSAPEPVATLPDDAAPEPVPVSEPPAIASSERAHLDVSLGAVWSAGTLPEASLGVAASVGLHAGYFSTQLSLDWLGIARRQEGDIGGEFSSGRGVLSVCARFVAAPVSVRACLDGGLLGIWSQGLGFATNVTSFAPQFIAGASLRVALALDDAFILLEPTVMALTHADAYIGPSALVLHRPDALLFALRLSVGFDAPL